MFFASLLFLFSSTASAEPDFNASVPASGDENFPINGELWLFGRDLSQWPSQMTRPNGFPKEDNRPPWVKNPDLQKLWREPRRVRWHETNRRERLRALVPPGSGIAVVEAETGRGIEFSSELFPVAYRPPLSPGEAGQSNTTSGANNVFQLLVIQPTEELKRQTDYALVTNGELVLFSTADGPDREAPSWDGLSEIRHESENNSLYEAQPVTDNSPYPARIELYRGNIEDLKIRQFALVGSSFQTGRLSPFSQGCIFAKAIDVAGNSTDMLPCFEFPPIPEWDSGSSEGGCASSNRQADQWSFILLAMLVIARTRPQEKKAPQESSP